METIISILTRFVADTVWCCTDSPRVVYTFPNGNVMTLALAREPGRSTWITRRDYAFNNTTLYWHRTAYDAEGRPTETEDSLTAIRQWLYNRRSELIGASGTLTHPYDYAYSYDSAGNRLTASDGSGAIPYTSNELNQYTSLYLRGETLLYDADGNLTQDDRFNYACAANNLNQYTAVNRTIEQSEQSNNSSVEYFWGNDLSGTEQGAGGVGGLLATRIDGVFYVPVYGANGNVMMYVDVTGAIAAQYDYDPYGNILQATGPLATQLSFDFSTKYHDREVGLVAYQLRTYDPTHGRWLNRDPIEEDGGNGLYLYCYNSFLFDVLGAYAYQSTIWGGFFYQNQTGSLRFPN